MMADYLEHHLECNLVEQTDESKVGLKAHLMVDWWVEYLDLVKVVKKVDYWVVPWVVGLVAMMVDHLVDQKGSM
jgi:hypothetical protein